jgi:hypothetical protein
MQTAQEQYIEAIDFVGKTIFGRDWIGKQTDEEKGLIDKYGPRPAKRGGMTISPCPPELLSKLDRALSSAQRVLPQRGAAADWLLDHGLVRDDGCDMVAIASALAKCPTSETALGAKVGRPSRYVEISIQMKMDVASAKRTPIAIKTAIGKQLQGWYGADPATCRKARKLALSSFS